MNTEETKKCRECQTDIPKKARRCPNCRTKQGIGLGGLIVVVMFVGITASVVMSSLTPSTPETPKTPADMTAVQSELEAYATEYLINESEPDRWTKVTSGQGAEGIIIRVTVSTEVPVNSIATGIYCDKIEEIIRRNASGHLRDTTAFISQYGENVKTCVY
jgi:Tfp pilus assembly protein PilE